MLALGRLSPGVVVAWAIAASRRLRRRDRDLRPGNPASGGAGGAGGALQLGELRKAAAAAGKLIGTAVADGPLRDEPTYAAVLAREFDYVTPENATKWGPLAPTAGSYDWAAADAIVDAAAAQAQAVKGHALVWHQQTPSWVTAAMTADELGAALKAHIETTLAHFRGRDARVGRRQRSDRRQPRRPATGRASSGRSSGRVTSRTRFAGRAPPIRTCCCSTTTSRSNGWAPSPTPRTRCCATCWRHGTPIDGIGFQSHLSIHRYPADERPARQLPPLRRAGPARERQRARRAHAADARLAGQPLAGAAASRSSRWWAPAWSNRRARRSRSGDSPTSTRGSTTTAEPDDPLPFDRSYMPKPAYDGILDGLGGPVAEARRQPGRATATSRPAPTAGRRAAGCWRWRWPTAAPDPRRASAGGPTRATARCRSACSTGCRRAVRCRSRPGRGCAARHQRATWSPSWS